MVKVVECPRDAMQGLHEFIPTKNKVNYLNKLLKVGFHTLDFGSFVSEKAIPQLRDTAKVLSRLDLSTTKTKLLAIVANERGADAALAHEEIDFLGFPFSISEQFQMRNTNSTIADSIKRVEAIQKKVLAKNKTLVVYISMAFGNPYKEKWDKEIALNWSARLAKDLGVKVISLSDTIGVSNPENIKYLFEALIPEFPDVEFGAHLHTLPINWKEKLEASYAAGCRRFDGAIRGFGGCPMANDDLVGNMATENIVQYFNDNANLLGINQQAFRDAYWEALRVFPN